MGSTEASTSKPLPFTEHTRLTYLDNHDLVRRLSEADLSNYVELASDLNDCSMAYVALVDDKRTMYLETKNLDSDALDRDGTPDFKVVRTGSPEVVTDLKNGVYRGKQPLETVNKWYWRGWAAVPLTTREQHVIGTVGVASRVPRQFDQVDVHCLHTIAWEITNRIHESFDENRVKSDRAVLKTAVEELTLFRNLVDESNDAFMVVCPESGRYIRVNDEACRQQGYSRDELLDMTIMDLVEDVDDQSQWNDTVNRLRQDNRMYLESTHQRRDGSSYPAEVSLRYDEAGELVTAVVRNISERKKREQELKRINTFLQSIVSNLPGIVYVKNAGDLSFELCNSGLEELVGHSRETIVGKTDFDLFPDDEAEFYRMQDREVLDRGEKKVVNEPLTIDGEKRVYRSHKVPITDESGDPLYLLGFTEDVTERIRVREELEHEKQFLQELLESAPEAVLVVDETIRLTRINQKAESMFGYNRDALLGMELSKLISEPYRDDHIYHVEQYFLDSEARERGTETALYGLSSKGEDFPVEIRLNPLDVQGSPRVIVTLRERG